MYVPESNSKQLSGGVCALISYVEERKNALGLDVLQVLAYQPRNLKPVMLAYSDIQFVFTTLQMEGQGFASKVYTIMACGTPVVTYRTGGSPEAVDEKTGVVVDQGDVVAVANAITGLKDKPLSSVDCRARAERCFDRDKCFEQYMELYESLIKD